MKLFISSTSPFARIVRILLQEKGIAHEEVLVDPWASPAALIDATPTCKVPALVDAGVAISHSLLIAQYLEAAYPERALAIPSPCELAQSALAFGALEAFASIIIGRRTRPDFDDAPVGLRRRGAIEDALQRLNVGTSTHHECSMPSLANIITVVLLDAVRFRFGHAHWIPDVPALDALSNHLNQRASFASTRPILT